jgi:hypothetical protein
LTPGREASQAIATPAVHYRPPCPSSRTKGRRKAIRRAKKQKLHKGAHREDTLVAHLGHVKVFVGDVIGGMVQIEGAAEADVHGFGSRL